MSTAYKKVTVVAEQPPTASVATIAAARWLLLGLLALGLLARLVFALQPVERLLIWLEDDAWMVQVIARNFAQGHGVSADGVNPTNGFHPLYPLALGSIPYLFDARPHGWGLPLNMALCALLNTLALIPLYLLARRFTGALPALLAAGLVALNLSFIRLSVNGMETSLALLLCLTLLWLFFTRERRSVRDGLLLGGLAGLAILARLDAVLLIGTLGLVWGWQVLQRRLPIGPFVAFGGLTAALFGAYLGVNHLVFGNPQPSSGRALAYMHSYAEDFYLFKGLGVVSLNPLLPLPWLGPPSLAVLALIVAAGLSLWLVRGQARVLLAVLAIYLLLVAVYYGYVLQHLQPRYLVLLAALSALWFALIAHGLQQRVGRALVVPLAAALLVICSLASLAGLRFYERAASGPQLTQPAMYEAALWMAANLPPDAVVGAKNSGIYQFYSQRTVINLDGKLNNDMIPVFEQRALLDYMQQHNIAYIVERPSVLLPWLGRYEARLADVPPHYAHGLRERVAIYGQLALSRLGLAEPPQIARRYDGPVRDIGLLTPLAAFERRNTPDDPVRIYRITYP